MTLIAENGTGIIGANSYSTVAEADAFHLVRANVAWAEVDDTTKVAALVRATDYLNAHYRPFLGPRNPDQGLAWPTVGSTTVPAAVVTSTIILALYALSGPLIVPAERGIKSTKESLDGVASEETTYDDAAPVDPYPSVTALMSRIANRDGVGGMVVGRLVR